MNIHFTYDCPLKCAQHLDNVRVNKMLTETVQIITTAWWVYNHPGLVTLGRKKDFKHLVTEIVDANQIMRPTHANHPSTIWARECMENMEWTLSYTEALFEEFKRRFNNNSHKSFDKLMNLMAITDFSFLPINNSMTPFANCARASNLGIDYTHMDDVHSAYRLYLYDRWNNDKRPPSWAVKVS